jgi:hypothetical protein
MSETDRSKVIGRIAEAKQAMEAGLFNLIEKDGAEHQAIQAAWKALAIRSRHREGPTAATFMLFGTSCRPSFRAR